MVPAKLSGENAMKQFLQIKFKLFDNLTDISTVFFVSVTELL